MHEKPESVLRLSVAHIVFQTFVFGHYIIERKLKIHLDTLQDSSQTHTHIHTQETAAHLIFPDLVSAD